MKSPILNKEPNDRDWAAFEAAAAKALGAPGKQGRAVKSGAQEEQTYSIAYHKLAMEGSVYRLKKKFR